MCAFWRQFTWGSRRWDNQSWASCVIGEGNISGHVWVILSRKWGQNLAKPSVTDQIWSGPIATEVVIWFIDWLLADNLASQADCHGLWVRVTALRASLGQLPNRMKTGRPQLLLEHLVSSLPRCFLLYLPTRTSVLAVLPLSNWCLSIQTPGNGAGFTLQPWPYVSGWHDSPRTPHIPFSLQNLQSPPSFEQKKG